MKLEELSNGVSVWVPGNRGWLPATVTAHDESETFPNSKTGNPGDAVITVEVHLAHDGARQQFQKVDAGLLRRRDPAARGEDKPQKCAD